MLVREDKHKTLRQGPWTNKFVHATLILIGTLNILAMMGCSDSSSTTPSIHQHQKTQNDTSLDNVPYRPLNQLTPSDNQWSAPADPELTPLTPAQPSQSKTPDLEPQHRWGCMVHRTRPGDTLYSIAQSYYGHAKHWQLIGQNNLNALNNQGQLLADVLIYLPTDPLKTSAATLNPPHQLPIAYITAPADTLKRIAHWLAADPQTLKSLNHLSIALDQPLPPGTKLNCR